MAEHKSILQSNVGWLETFKMGRKAPAVANRIFDTLADAQAYADDPGDSATEGVRITVLNDGDNNGVYYISSIGNGNGISGVLVKICRSTCAWFKGNHVDMNHLSFNVPHSEPGDAYLNVNTLDIFVLGADGVWELLGNMNPEIVDRNRCYYIITDNSDTLPTFTVGTGHWRYTIEDAKADAESIGLMDGGQAYLWTRLYDETGDSSHNLYVKHSCSLISSSLNLGVFSIGTV